MKWLTNIKFVGFFLCICNIFCTFAATFMVYNKLGCNKASAKTH